MTIAARANDKGRFTGWHALAMMLAFFGITIAVNAVFIMQALKTFPGEDAPKSYVQGLRFNETLSERAKQRALGWRVEAALEQSARGPRAVARFVDARGAPLSGLAVTGTLHRPAAMRDARVLTFTALGDGRYAAELGALAAGGWDVSLRAVRGDDALDAQARLIWP